MSARFPIIPSKTAMLFFDTLNGGLHPHGPDASVSSEISAYIARLVAMERACRSAGIRIFYTLPEHRPDGSDWALRVIGDPPEVTNFKGVNYRGSYHATIIPDIEPQPGDYIITKHRWSAFYQTCLDLSLRSAGIDTIMLAGGSTQIGIASTAYSARDHDYNVIILSDAIRSRQPDINEFFLDTVFPRLARIMTTSQAVNEFDTSGMGGSTNV
jgi:nicotinamidase-related amidase